MYCIEAKAKIDIPLGEDYEQWDSIQLKQFIKTKGNPMCDEFAKAVEWIGDRNYKQAIEECKNVAWVNWLKARLPLYSNIIRQGTEVTLTSGRNEKYALWHSSGIWDLPEEYVGEIVRIISEN